MSKKKWWLRWPLFVLRRVRWWCPLFWLWFFFHFVALEGRKKEASGGRRGEKKKGHSSSSSTPLWGKIKFSQLAAKNPSPASVGGGKYRATSSPPAIYLAAMAFSAPLAFGPLFLSPRFWNGRKMEEEEGGGRTKKVLKL